MNKENLIIFFNDYTNNEPSDVIEKGVHWFQQTCLPLLVKATEMLPVEKELLTETYLLTGEVYELIYAPLAAATFYKKAIELTPDSLIAHQWLSTLEEDLGNYVPAMNYIEIAIELAPEEESLMWDRQRIQDCLVYDKEPEIDMEQPLYKYGKLLSHQQFDTVIQVLSTPLTTDFDELRCLAAAFGGKNDLANYSLIEERILQLQVYRTFEEFDLFYATVHN